MRNVMDGGRIFKVYEGKYIRLHVNGELMMTDTHMERFSNDTFVYKANGSVLIAGLGVGMIINALRDKIDSGIVTSITVVEKYQEVVDIIAPYFSDLKITYIVDDILNVKPKREVKFDTIYFDIWPKISTDNLTEISTLHNRFKNSLNRDNPNFWMNSWMAEYLRAERRKESRYSYW